MGADFSFHAFHNPTEVSRVDIQYPEAEFDLLTVVDLLLNAVLT